MDLIGEIAKDECFSVDIGPLGFDAAPHAVQANQADGVIAGTSITDERKNVFDFSEGDFESRVQMSVLDSTDDIDSYENLPGKRVSVKSGLNACGSRGLVHASYHLHRSHPHRSRHLHRSRLHLRRPRLPRRRHPTLHGDVGSALLDYA